jgi:hypothetical protein
MVAPELVTSDRSPRCRQALRLDRGGAEFITPDPSSRRSETAVLASHRDTLTAKARSTDIDPGCRTPMTSSERRSESRVSSASSITGAAAD